MGLICGGSKTYEPKVGLLLMTVLLATLFMVNFELATAEVPQNLSDSIKIMAEQKVKVEQWAIILKKDLQEKIQPVTYRHSVSLYIDASAAFNALIEKMKYDITIGKSDGYEKYVNEAAIKGETFVTFVEALSKQIEMRDPPTRGAISNLLLGLTEAVLKIWKEVTSMDTKQREEVIKQLDGLKWRPFDQLP